MTMKHHDWTRAAGGDRGRGRTRLVAVNTSSFIYEPLRELLLRAFGPLAIVSDEFADLGGVHHLFIFGSWAARYTGVSGHEPRDVDVLIIGAPDRVSAYEAAERAERQLHRPVQVTIRTLEQWRDPQPDQFLAEVQRRPIVEVYCASAASAASGTNGPRTWLAAYEPAEHARVRGGGLWHPRTRRSKPVFDLLPRDFGFQRRNERTRVRCDAQECSHSLPRKPDSRLAVESTDEPCTRSTMMRIVGIAGVQQDVRIEQHQPCASPSRSASASSMSSSGRRARPIAETFCWNGLCAASGWASPRRARALTTSLRSPGHRALFDGAGRLELDELAEMLDAEVVPRAGRRDQVLKRASGTA